MKALWKTNDAKVDIQYKLKLYYFSTCLYTYSPNNTFINSKYSFLFKIGISVLEKHDLCSDYIQGDNRTINILLHVKCEFFPFEFD